MDRISHLSLTKTTCEFIVSIHVTLLISPRSRAQHAVLTKCLGVSKVFCVVGFSMGGQQAYHWPVVFPDFVERFVAICTSARTSPHNQWSLLSF